MAVMAVVVCVAGLLFVGMGALIDRPEMLLADEPTGNVDPPMARRLLSLFLELNRLGTAVVIATHDLSLMDQVEARRMILSQGRLDIYD